MLEMAGSIGDAKSGNLGQRLNAALTLCQQLQ
jgi:hypothetical protein